MRLSGFIPFVIDIDIYGYMSDGKYFDIDCEKAEVLQYHTLRAWINISLSSL
jgi:hypothetical protein